jgi:hypothetical protein
MASIENLVLTLSRSSDGTVGVRVRYTAVFGPEERSIEGLRFSDNAYLIERKGLRDDARGFEMFTDAPDTNVAWLNMGGFFSPSDAKDGKVERSAERDLTDEELGKLREVGREHAYVGVQLQPVGIEAAFKVAEVEIDIGDPGE